MVVASRPKSIAVGLFSSGFIAPFIELHPAVPYTRPSVVSKPMKGIFSDLPTGAPFTVFINHSPFNEAIVTGVFSTSFFSITTTLFPSLSQRATLQAASSFLSQDITSKELTFSNAPRTLCSVVISGHAIRVPAIGPKCSTPGFKESTIKVPIIRLHPLFP